MTRATITRLGILDAQVCVPQEWDDEEVILFFKTEVHAPSAMIRKQGDPALSGDPERAPCSDRPGFVHIVLDY